MSARDSETATSTAGVALRYLFLAVVTAVLIYAGYDLFGVFGAFVAVCVVIGVGALGHGERFSREYLDTEPHHDNTDEMNRKQRARHFREGNE